MKVYLSDIHSAWPFRRQEAALDAGLPGWREGSVYRDKPKRGERSAKSVLALAQRATMLRPTSRSQVERLHVAALPVLAWTVSDLLAVLAAATKRGATLVDLDTGLEVSPDATPEQVAQVCQEYERACRRVGEYGKSGGIVSGERRAAAARAGADRIKERWPLPSADHPTRALLAEAGISRPTAIRYLGERRDAQRIRAAGQAVADRNRARRKSDD